MSTEIYKYTYNKLVNSAGANVLIKNLYKSVIGKKKNLWGIGLCLKISIQLPK